MKTRNPTAQLCNIRNTTSSACSTGPSSFRNRRAITSTRSRYCAPRPVHRWRHWIAASAKRWNSIPEWVYVRYHIASKNKKSNQESVVKYLKNLLCIIYMYTCNVFSLKQQTFFPKRSNEFTFYWHGIGEKLLDFMEFY